MLIKAGVPPCFSRNARVDYFTQPCFDFYNGFANVLPKDNVSVAMANLQRPFVGLDD